VIRLTDEWTKSAAARAVPGSEFDPGTKAWVLREPTPRAAAVALKLFPHLEHSHPELLELRDLLTRDAKPVDYATPGWGCASARPPCARRWPSAAGPSSRCQRHADRR
jgi:hypothetical protein